MADSRTPDLLRPVPVRTLADRHQAMHMLGGIELRRHRLVVVMMEMLLDEVPLTPAQAREVFTEIRAREALIRELQRIRNLEQTGARSLRRRAAAAEACPA